MSQRFNTQVNVDIALDDIDGLPSTDELALWADTAIHSADTHSPARPLPSSPELSIRVVGRKESQTLNQHYRGKDKPTNVLSFPAEFPEGLDIPLLGDLVICSPVVASEADEQNKTLEAHWAHMVIHGTLHLMGYDHIHDKDAELMEALETSLLQSLGYDDPYQALK